MYQDCCIVPALNHIGMAISEKAVQQTKEFSSGHWTVRKRRNLCSEIFLANSGQGNTLLFVVWFLKFLTLEFPSAYSCHVCGFETEMNVQFVSHMSLHVDKEQWMFSICCTACDFVTMEEADMKAHVNSKHTGDDPPLPAAVISLFLAF